MASVAPFNACGLSTVQPHSVPSSVVTPRCLHLVPSSSSMPSASIRSPSIAEDKLGASQCIASPFRNNQQQLTKLLSPPRSFIAHKPRKYVTARAAAGDEKADSKEDEKAVLVFGATGGVGQLIVASLLQKGKKVRAVARDRAKAEAVFLGAPEGMLEVVSADLRFPDQLTSELMENVGWVVLATGTTAFPSKRWDGNNGPEQTDYISVKNFMDFCPKTVERILLVSSVGVLRYNQLPFNILNLFGVLKYKRMAEEMIQASGIPYTILRPGRLTDGPYTSYDLNTLLRATSGSRKSVVIKRGDSLSLEASRVAVAEAAAQALLSESAKNGVFEIGSVDGPWPGSDLGSWDNLFASAPVA